MSARRSRDTSIEITGQRPAATTPSKIGKAGKAKRSAKAGKAASAAASGATDVSLSSSPGEVEQAAQVVAAMPDTRVEKVDAIKPLVDDGSYHVESDKVAKKVVDSSLRESARQDKASK